MKIIFSFSIITVISLLFSFTAVQKPNAKSAIKTLNNFCVYVPSGNSIIDEDTLTVQAFYMSQEITNIQYAEFLAYLRKNGESEKLKQALVDSSKWTTAFQLAYLEPMRKQYHRHPAYHDYPVVNVSKEGAVLFCDWLTRVYDSISGGELKLKFRIPSRAEYMRAAGGDNFNSPYTWQGSYLRNSEGCYLANCIQISDGSITRDKETGEFKVVTEGNASAIHYSDGTFITAPSRSYWPNEFGLYNINGNVAEMISDGNFAVGGSWNSPGYDIRNESIKDFTEAHPTVGFRVVATYMTTAK